MANLSTPTLYQTHGQLCTSRSRSDRDSDSPTVFPPASWKHVSTTTTKMTVSRKNHLLNGDSLSPPSEYPYAGSHIVDSCWTKERPENRESDSGHCTGGIDPESHPACRSLLGMGYSPSVVKKAADELRKRGQTLTENSLLDAITEDTPSRSDQNATKSSILSHEEPMTDCVASQPPPSCDEDTPAKPQNIHSPDEAVQKNPPSSSSTGGSKQKVLGDVMAENERLKEASRCKVCLDADFDTVFLPCCHLVCCRACASCVKECPICRQKILGTVKAYAA